jgi:elongation factor G
VKEYTTSNIRNITIIGHGGCGKTSFAEALLFSTGTTTRLGRIEDGNTISDFSAEEINRKISISASLLNCNYNNIKLNIIDTPGFSDFVGEVKCGLKVADTAVVLVNAIEGVEVGTEMCWKNGSIEHIPTVFVANKLDHENSDFEKCIESIKNKFGGDVIVTQFPLNTKQDFDSIVDVVKMKLVKYEKNGSGKCTESDIPADILPKANKLREELIEKVAETDEAIMNSFFENAGLTDDEFTKGLRIGLKNRKLFPILCASSTKNIGILGILSFAENYLPAPNMRSSIKVTKANSADSIDLNIDSNGETVMFVFKTVSEKNIGEMSYFKVLSGKVSSGMDLQNSSVGKSERLSQISTINGKERKEIAEVIAGDIAAAVKLKDTHSNNTLCSKSINVIAPLILFPEPVISLALIPKSKGEEDKVASGLHKIHEEDPTFVFKVDPELNQTIISGQGELHLNILVKRFKERYGVDVDIVEPKIPYREAIKGKVQSIEYKHKKQSGGRGQFGHVFLKIEPLPRGEGFQFENEVVGGVVPGRFIPAVEKGVIETMSKGVIAGYKIVDVKVTIFDGSHHSVDSDEMSFKIAGTQAFKKGFKEAKPILLEPIYIIEITIPDKYMGDIMGDLTSRRGRIMGMEAEGDYQVVKAQVPMAEIHQYATILRSMTQGRGFFTRKFSHYDEVPKEEMDKIIAATDKSKEEDEE